MAIELLPTQERMVYELRPDQPFPVISGWEACVPQIQWISWNVLRKRGYEGKLDRIGPYEGLVYAQENVQHSCQCPSAVKTEEVFQVLKRLFPVPQIDNLQVASHAQELFFFDCHKRAIWIQYFLSYVMQQKEIRVIEGRYLTSPQGTFFGMMRPQQPFYPTLPKKGTRPLEWGAHCITVLRGWVMDPLLERETSEEEWRLSAFKVWCFTSKRNIMEEFSMPLLIREEKTGTDLYLDEVYRPEEIPKRMQELVPVEWQKDVMPSKTYPI